MPIVVGYVPTPEGRAALDRAIEEARLRGLRLVVVNASSLNFRAAPGLDGAPISTLPYGAGMSVKNVTTIDGTPIRGNSRASCISRICPPVRTSICSSSSGSNGCSVLLTRSGASSKRCCSRMLDASASSPPPSTSS